MAKLINCKTCGTQMASNAKKCPSCGAKNKKPVYKKWWVYVLIVIVIAAMVLGGCSGDGENREITDAEGADKISTTIEEQMLFAANDVKITAKEYIDDSIWGEGIKLLIENNSSDDVGVGCSALMVNDYMIYDLFSEVVAAGKKVNTTLYLYSSQLKAAGIDSVGKVEVQFYLYDADSYMTTYTADTVTVETSNFAKLDTTVSIEGTNIYNGDGVKIVGKSVDEDSFWGAAILLYIENNSGENIVVQCDDVSINGFMITPLFSCEVYNEKKAVDTIDFFSSELKENGIETIEKIELKFKIINADTWTNIYETDVITITAG